jgi:predicted dehydrogenase
MKLRVGVIGTGFGSQVQIPAFQAHPRAEVVAVSSRTPGKAAKIAEQFGVRQAFDRYQDLVTADLDLVSVTAPPSEHYAMILAAVAAGRHVLCEKPMAMDTHEASEMLERAESRGVVHAIDHELRFNPNRRKIKVLIDEGFIGRPRHALITIVGTARLDPAHPWTWWSDRSSGGGVLGAQGSHQVDLLRFWLGDVVAVSGTIETYVRERPSAGRSRSVTSDDFTTFSLRFATGAIASVLLSSVASHVEGPRAELWGDEGTLRLDGQERLWGARRGGEWREMTEPETLAAPPGMDYSPLWGISFVRFANHLVNAILDGAPLAPAATFADGLNVQRVLDAVRDHGQAWRKI